MEQPHRIFTKGRMQNIEINGQNFKLQGKVGEGCTAEVFKATSTNKQTVCVKVIKQHFYRQPTGKALIDNQIQIIAQLTHPSLLTFHKHTQKPKITIVTEFCEGGTLYDLLKSRGKIPEAQTLPIMRQLIEGCSYMHTKNILHRDLKPENIFFRDKARRNIAVADFGFSVSMADKSLIKANVGSPLYMPYEALADNNFSPSSDIFALGVIWHELLTGKTPFQAVTQRQLKQQTKKEQFRIKELPCNQSVKDIIFRCLKCQPHQRPSLNEIMTAVTSKSLAKVKSKSVIVTNKPLFSVQDKRLSKEKKSQKEVKDKVEKKSFKQNKDPINCLPGITKNQKSKTFIERLKGVDKTKAEQRQLKLDQGNILVEESKKIFSQSSLLSKDQLISLLKSLSQLKLTFLPGSVHSKFNKIVLLYQELLTVGSIQQKTNEDDELISSLSCCQEEQEFCIGSFGFLRRLLRLSKTYNFNMNELNRLWNHIQAKCLQRA